MNKYQNAIGVIKACGLNIKGSAELLEDVKQIENTIIEALEKQIPKKPTPQIVKGGKRLIGNGWWCNGTTVYRCPNCNEWITLTYDYCINCGQAIDWSDTNDR